ncbi:ANTAR domain-containing protein [Geodermatophilus sp. SYSU D00965]
MTATPSPTLGRSRPVAEHPTPAARPGASAARPVPTPHRLAGRFRHDRRTGNWAWSPEMARLLGLPRGGAHPCAELLARALHPGDRSRALDAITRACADGLPFSLRVRLGSRSGLGTPAVLVGEPVVDAAGSVDALEGLLVLLPEEAEVDAASCAHGSVDDRVQALETEVCQLRTAMASRAAIEQAKGILMLLTSCGEQVAFDLLAHISSNCHRKVRDVAVAIAESAAGRSSLPADVRALIRDVCPPTPRMH